MNHGSSILAHVLAPALQSHEWPFSHYKSQPGPHTTPIHNRRIDEPILSGQSNSPPKFATSINLALFGVQS